MLTSPPSKSKEARKAYARKHYLANKEKYKANHSKYYLENKEKFAAYRTNWIKENASLYKLKERERHLISSFGINLDNYQKLLDSQNGVCAICGAYPKKRSLHVDHCHNSGRVRGLLCFRCNAILGLCNDNHFALDKASMYLKKHSQ